MATLALEAPQPEGFFLYVREAGGGRAAKTRTRGGQGLDTEPQGRGQDKRRTRPGHRAQPQSPATLTEFRRTRPGHRAQPQGPDRVQGRGQDEEQGLDTEPSHRVNRVQGRGQDKEKRRTGPGHRAQR